MTYILPSTPEAFKFVRNIEEFEVLLCRYLPSAQMYNLCPLWNAYALPVLLRLWLDFPQFRSCIEEKPDYRTYLLALHQLHWITLGVSGELEEALLMEEFASNMKLLVCRRILYHDVDPKLLETPLHLLTRDEQFALLIELRMTEMHHWSRMERRGPLQIYPGIKVNHYGSTIASTFVEDILVNQEVMWI
jgi:hypothetical protein